MRMLVYFDVNVFGNLAESTANAKNKIKKLRGAIDRGKISICPSFECFAELIFALKHNQGLYIKLRDLYYSLADWKHILKDAADVFKDDILAFAKTENKDSPFANIDNNCEFINNVRAGKNVLAETHLRKIIDKSHKKAQIFVSVVLSPGPLDHIKGNYTERDFLGLWEAGNTAEIMASDFARKLRVLRACRSRGITRMLGVPTIRLGIGYILFSWYKQISSNANIEISDAYDYRHVVLAGAVGNIVTEDRKLRNAIHAIRVHNIKVWTLDGFIGDVL